MCYLEESSKVEDSGKLSKGSRSAGKVREVTDFDDRSGQFREYFELLFDQLDKSKSGSLNRLNCYCLAIKEEFKLAFGYILIRIKMKDLVVNKEEFVKLALLALKELDSEEFNALLKGVRMVQ